MDKSNADLAVQTLADLATLCTAVAPPGEDIHEVGHLIGQVLVALADGDTTALHFLAKETRASVALLNSIDPFAAAGLAPNAEA